MHMPDWIRASGHTGLEWSLADGVVHVHATNGLILDVTIVRLAGHRYLVSGFDRHGSATNYGMKRIDGIDPDSIRAYVQGIAG